MSNQHLTEQTFANLDLAEPLLRGVAEAGFHFCTPIQAATLPIALAGRDVAGQAQTGTGKTAAFLLALFNRLIKQDPIPTRAKNQPRALVLAPTRELAIQIHNDAVALGKYTGFSLGLVYGGTGYDTQRKMLEDGVDVLIGTPGRIIDYFKQHVFDLMAVQVMVLDEADRMFDLGFIKDIRFLLRRMPPPTERLGMLFSATLSFRVNELAYEHMNNPNLIKIESDKVTADKVTQLLYHTANEEKLPLLIGLMRSLQPMRSLVFTNTKGAAERVQHALNGNGLRAEVLSGDVPQTKRQRLLGEFQNGEFPVLVATDVAARGLHIPEVTHVFNYDLPQDPEDYVHRIGRTARAGASGDAISFACEEYAFSVMDIEEYIGSKIPVGRINDAMLADITITAMPRREGGDARRGGGRHGRNERPRRGASREGRGERPARPPAAARRETAVTANPATGDTRGARADTHTDAAAPAHTPVPATAPIAAKDSLPAAESSTAGGVRRQTKPETKPARPAWRRKAPEKPAIG